MMATRRYVVVAFGEALVDLIAPDASESLFTAPAFHPQPGGAPANVAVGVARLGAPAAFIGKVGADDFGAGLRQLFAAESVATSGLVTDPHSHTTLACVGVSPQGEPRFTFAAGAHTRLLPEEVDQRVLAEGQIFAFGSVMLAHEPARSTTFATLTRARDAGMTLAYDVNWRPALWPDAAVGRALVRIPLHQVDVVKMNAQEATLLTGIADPYGAIEQLETSARLVVVTLGAAGCLFRRAGVVKHVPGRSVGPVVDTIGAGDAFMATLLAGLPVTLAKIDESAVRMLLQRACLAGAWSVTRRGAMPSLPYATDLVS